MQAFGNTTVDNITNIVDNPIGAANQIINLLADALVYFPDKFFDGFGFGNGAWQRTDARINGTIDAAGEALSQLDTDAQNGDYRAAGGDGMLLIMAVIPRFKGKGVAPPNLSPAGAGRTGAFKAAKRQSGIRVGEQPSAVKPNLDRRGNVQPGKVYEFTVPAPGGGSRIIKIRDDVGGHDFGPGNSQNRNSHFNDEAGNHYDY